MPRSERGEERGLIQEGAAKKRPGADAPGPRIVAQPLERAPISRSSLLQQRERLRDHVVVIVRHLPLRRHLVDQLRQHLREAARGVAVRHPELLRDLAELARAQHLLQRVAGDRHVLPGATPTNPPGRA